MTRSCSAWLTTPATKSALRAPCSPPNGSAIEPDWSSTKTMSVGLARVICAVYAIARLCARPSARRRLGRRVRARREARPALVEDAEEDVDRQHGRRRAEHGRDER